MTARDIQRQLIRERYAKTFVIPNHTPRGWFECDVMEITKAGLMVEYEIKVSRSDFFADGLKCFESDWRRRVEIHHSLHNPDKPINLPPAVFKHDLLRKGDTRGPARFWFVMPEGMIQHHELPSWAGMIWADKLEHRTAPCLRVVRKAPRLHRQKADDSIQQYGFVSCYWRMHRLMLRDPSAVIEPDQPMPV